MEVCCTGPKNRDYPTFLHEVSAAKEMVLGNNPDGSTYSVKPQRLFQYGGQEQAGFFNFEDVYSAGVALNFATSKNLLPTLVQYSCV
jgi:hypothetical protein